MSRLLNAFAKGPATANYPAPMLDLRRGGQQGYGPDLPAWVSNQAYIQQNLVVLLIEAPVGFKYMPDPNFWIGALKALIETHPKSITGFNAGLSTEFFDANPVSGGGEIQEDLTDVKRERSAPSFTWVEKYGRPIQTFWYEFITNLGMDPDTKIPNISTLPGIRPGDLLADMSTFTVLAFEPDPTYTKVMKAWLTTNMFPKSTGEITGKRELSSAKSGLELTVDFTAISQSSLGVRLFAQAILNNIIITNANPNLAPAFVNAIDPNVLAAETPYGGYAEQAAAYSATAI